MDHQTGKQSLDPTSLEVADAARLLSTVGGKRIGEEALEADLVAGAPTNQDGTINLVHLAAWLVQEMSGGD